MTTEHPTRCGQSTTLAATFGTLATDAAAVLTRAVPGSPDELCEELDDLQHRAEVLRERLLQERIQGGRHWLEGLQRGIAALKGPGGPRRSAGSMAG